MDNLSLMSHSLITSGRESLKISGVKEVLSFDDETLLLDTVAGRMTVKGEGMHIISYHTESGDLSAEGKLNAIVYSAPTKGGLSRLFR